MGHAWVTQAPRVRAEGGGGVKGRMEGAHAVIVMDGRGVELAKHPLAAATPLCVYLSMTADVPLAVEAQQ